ncbi:MAG: hypothetical protein JRG76_15370 [Deltaproteobacteria bacterium]|nr:hypothetical protein [Deltaproteobacteria bacterium]MBW2415879.1 hypothetical protein [Deltaproteobacteria bacterium]
MILGLVGATGAVGEEVLSLLQQRRVPVQVRAFASEDSEGLFVDWMEDEIAVEAVTPERLGGCELVICAAPLEPGVLAGLREAGVTLLDLSGALEDEADVPLIAGPLATGPRDAPVVAAARGVTVGLAVVLQALSREAELVRVTVTTLESAGGAGRRGLDTLSEQTVSVLNAMDGAPEGGGVFPAAIAFDCLPQVGDPLPSGATTEEERLAVSLRRLLSAPSLPVQVTRIRVPVFLGSLAVLDVELAKELPLDRAASLIEAAPDLELLGAGELPTPRGAVGGDSIQVGRLRAGKASLSLVLAQDDLRRGAAQTAVELVEARLA